MDKTYFLKKREKNIHILKEKLIKEYDNVKWAAGRLRSTSFWSLNLPRSRGRDNCKYGAVTQPLK